MDQGARVSQLKHAGPRKLRKAEVLLNITSKFNEQARTTAHNGACAARRTTDRLIVIRFGIAGAIIAAAIGYLIEWRATGGATGFAGAVVCPVFFIAAYQRLAQRAN